MKKTKLRKWTFTARLRRNAFGWKGSRLACQRIKEAVSEIKKVARKDPILGAEGAIKFMEKQWPALQHVDSSSGALGTATCLSCLQAAERYEELLELIESAPRISWQNRKYGGHALFAMGKKG